MEVLMKYGLVDNKELRLLLNDIVKTVIDIHEQIPTKTISKTTKYTEFIKHITTYRKAVYKLTVTLYPRFSTVSNTRKIYEKNAKLFPLEEEITISDLMGIIQRALANNGDKCTEMTKGAFLWNMLDDSNRQLVFSTTE
jgi:hypothetical protein